MRSRLLRVLIYILTPVLILACSVVFTGGSLHKWLLAQRDIPLLWLVDFCAAYTLLLLVAAIGSRDQANLRTQELIALRQENVTQWETINSQSDEREAERTELLQKVAELERRQGQEQTARVDETRHLTEQAFRAVQGQIEAQGRQLEAVNMALQHHRAEISQLRQMSKANSAADTVESHFAEAAQTVEYAAVSAAPIPRSLSERRETLSISPQPARDPDAALSSPSRSTIEL